MEKKAVVYTRISTGKDNQLLSLENQREYYEKYCLLNEYELLHIYAEEGKTGTNVRREQFKQMMYDAGLNYERNDNGSDIFRKTDRLPKFRYIICKDVSRFSRNQTVGLQTAELLRDLGVYIIFENSGLNTKDKNYKSMLSMLFMSAESESHFMSERIKFAKRHNAEKQNYRPSRLPFGYIRNEREIVINEQQANIVKFIYGNFSEIGSFKMAKILNEKGYVSQNGHEWTGDKVLRIIRNRIYTGVAIVNRSTKKNVTDTARIGLPEKEHIPIYNAVPPIVTLEEWKEVNKIREKRVNTSNKRGRKPVFNDLYYEKIYCENCGSRFVKHTTTSNTKTKKINYICNGRRKGKGCKIRGISINNLNRGLAEIDYRVGTMGDSINYKNLIKQIDIQVTILKESREILEKKISEHEEKSNNITSMMLSNFKSNKKLLQKLEKDFNHFEAEKTKLEHQKDNMNIEAINKLREKVENKKQLIEEINKKKKITEDEKLQLLQKVIIGDYQLEYFFSNPNYDEEISEFNTIFTTKPIEAYSNKIKTGEVIRRTHKEAKVFWEAVDENIRESEEFF